MIRIRQIEVNINEDSIDKIKYSISKKLNINSNDIKDIKINKKSIDARHKPNINFIYEVDIDVVNEDNILKHNKSIDILKTPIEEYKIELIGTKKLNNRPIIVGSGPAGLYTAYNLAKNGYKPIIIERGQDVDNRVKTVETFFDINKLDTNCNVQFGEGGAGTFSDGKLNTLVKDPNFRNKEVLKIFVECGANPDILYTNKPHIGTDKLREVVKNLRNKIISMGGTFRFNTCLTNIMIKDNKIDSIEVNNNEIIKTDLLVLAIGHSARDTFELLLNNNLDMEAKPFAIGIRIQHKQEMINMSQYGMKSHPKLENASYKLTYHSTNNRGVYSFCMCPGGFVVNASSEENRLAINGMSNSKRDTNNANSAIVVTITPDDFGNKPLDGVKFQRNLEAKAYKLGNGNIPVQLFKDYNSNNISKSFKDIEPVFKGNTTFANINDIFPDYINDALKEG
ncbi:MAG TPA: NAD(P)/FAD-dependent oxidoreductase, partial [Bacilli bacterium]|nr:NAD(P)/FAD-dependent oxidoreductase [Bacilli bacterium]